jgi:hypothetical protein
MVEFMIKSYSPITRDISKQTFFDYINELDLPEIDYFAIGIQNPKSRKSMSLMSLPEWQKQFTENQYAEYDPIRKVTFNTSRKVIPFAEVDYSDSYGKEIMHQRANFGIKNGLILVERLPHYNYMITLGTEFSKFDAFFFLRKYNDTLNYLKSDLIKIITKDANKFLKDEIIIANHLSSDAK